MFCAASRHQCTMLTTMHAAVGKLGVLDPSGSLARRLGYICFGCGCLRRLWEPCGCTQWTPERVAVAAAAFRPAIWMPAVTLARHTRGCERWQAHMLHAEFFRDGEDDAVPGAARARMDGMAVLLCDARLAEPPAEAKDRAGVHRRRVLNHVRGAVMRFL